MRILLPVSHWLNHAAKEKKSVQFNEEVQVKTVEQAVDVTEIDEVFGVRGRSVFVVEL